MPQIICRELSLGYNGVTVCDHLNFQINKGDYLCIVGDNGSGKTTLMKALLGLKSPDRGEIVWDRCVHLQSVGYLPQQSEHQRDFPATAFEVVLSGCVGYAKKGFFYTKKHREYAKDKMEQLGISHLARKSYSSLSGGQQQRVLLARALCAAHDLLLLDEPVSGLDPASTKEMYEIIEKLNRDGMTVIMITHDVPAVLKYAGCVLHMGERPEFFERAEDYKRAALLEVGEEERHE